MKNQDLKEDLKQEIETEAATLERRVNSKKELASLTMPEDSYQQLMKRIKARKRLKFQNYLFPRKSMATVAMVVILVTLAGLGVNGARLYILNVENRESNGSLDIAASTDDIFYVELTEEEAYEKIEEDLGILALRLGIKPNGMEMEKVYIDTDMEEALIEFYYNEHVLSIYENKQNSNVTFNTQPDGKIIDSIEIFHLGQSINITEIDKGNGELLYVAQLEYADAYYYISGDLELELFREIIYGIFVNT